MRASLLITGNELILGKIKDTNGYFLMEHLRRAGISVEQMLICGDSKEQLLGSLSYLSQLSDVILMTGGLGPTGDDLTAEVVGEFVGQPLEFREEAWNACVAFFEKLGRKEIPETNRKQAMLPKGAVIISNPVGTAVGFECVASRGKAVRIVCMPGVPAELEPMFMGEVMPSLSSEKVHTTREVWQFFQVGESALQERLASLEGKLHSRFSDLSISYQAHHGYVTWSLSFPRSGLEQEFLSAVRDEVEPFIERELGKMVISREEAPLQERLASLCRQSGLKLALAESCTGGLVAQLLTSVPGASDYFLGSAVVYSNNSKEEILGVSHATLESLGAVSEQVAQEMAEGALRVYGADLSISITGVAGPGGGTERHPVGCVCFGFSFSHPALDPDVLLRHLAPFGWKACPLRHGQACQSSVNFTAEKMFGSVGAREILQKRSAIFALGSIVAALECQKLL